MALVVAREGFRRGARWAWNATWAVVAAPITIGIVYMPTPEGGFLVGVGAIALVGQILAGRG